MPVNLTVYGQTDVGLVRPKNEDAFVIADLSRAAVVGEKEISRFEIGARGVLLAVSDGLGGHDAGEVASALVLESICRSLTASAGREPCGALMERATIRANREVWEAGNATGHRDMGATLTALFLYDRVAYIAEVGDSRAYLMRAGAIEQVTRDQSYVQVLIDKGALTPEQAKQSTLRNVVLQAMGVTPEVKVALGRLDLRARDCIIICSDGLSNKVGAAEMREIILQSPRLDEACARLIDLAKQRGGEDNITVIVAGVSGDLPPLIHGERIADTLRVFQEFDAPVPSRRAPI
jgi:serine/threonine protein phosphatase PrpC